MIRELVIPVLAVAMVLYASPLFFDLALCLAGNLVPPRRQRKPAVQAIRLAAIVPAHDEETMIARTVRSLLAADPTLPVYVVAHNCTDHTATLAAEAGAQVLELNDPNLRGKASALRHAILAALASGANAVLVIDADSVVSSNLIAATAAALSQGAAATQCRYELDLPAHPKPRPLPRLRALAFRGINVLRARGRARLGLSAGLFGNGFALAASTLARIPFSADSIAEDIEYHIKLVAAGLKVDWVEEARVSAPLAPAGYVQAKQEARWEGGKLRVALNCSGLLVSAILRGNLRAVEMLAEVWAVPLSRGVFTLILSAFVPLHWLHQWALLCAAITLLYVVATVLMGDDPASDLLALAAAPIHILWKAAITPLVLRQSRRRAAWDRTRREVQEP